MDISTRSISKNSTLTQLNPTTQTIQIEIDHNQFSSQTNQSAFQPTNQTNLTMCNAYKYHKTCGTCSKVVLSVEHDFLACPAFDPRSGRRHCGNLQNVERTSRGTEKCDKCSGLKAAERSGRR
jgi:hypothetical protein